MFANCFSASAASSCWSESPAHLVDVSGVSLSNPWRGVFLPAPAAWQKASLSMSAISKRMTLVYETATSLWDWMAETSTSQLPFQTSHLSLSHTVMLQNNRLIGVLKSFLLLLFVCLCILWLGLQNSTSLQSPMTTEPWAWWPGVLALSLRS